MPDFAGHNAPRQRPEGHHWFAAWYDTLNCSMERRLMGRLRSELLRSLRGKVLEIGAGTGANFPYYDEAAQVTATEPDPFMFRRARQQLAKAPEARIELRQASAESLPFADRTFDDVVSTLVLCTVPDPLTSLAEIRRVLKPEGRLHFIEHVRADGWLGRVQDLIRPVWRYVGAGCNPNRRTAKLMEDAGFRIEELRREKLPLGIPLLVGAARLAEVPAAEEVNRVTAPGTS